MARSLFRSNTLPVKLTVSKVFPKKTVGKTSNAAKHSKKKNVIRGKETTTRNSAAVYQILYGRMRAGGECTYVDTSSDSKAYLITGNSSDQNQLVWTAKISGAMGNDYSIQIYVSGTNGTRTVTVDTSSPPLTKIYIRLKSTSGASLDRMSDVISAIRGNITANGLVTINKLDNSKNGFVDNVSATSLSYGGGTKLFQMITLAGNQIDGVEKVYLDDKEVTFGGSPDPRWGIGAYNNKVFAAFQPGTNDQAAQPDLIAQKGSLWTENHRQLGCAGCFLLLKWDDSLFPQGLPESTFLTRGKPVFDPRINQTVWSRNSALIAADFLNNSRFGFGIPYSFTPLDTPYIDLDKLSDAANICDQDVDILPSGTEKRYCSDGIFDASQTREQTLKELLDAMAGYLVIQGSRRMFYAGAYRSPAVTFTEDDLRGQISFTTHISRSVSFNAVRATFADPTQNYNETDVPAVVNAFYVTQDRGDTVFEDLTLNFVTQSSQAQRLMKIELEKVRQGIVVTLPLKLSGLLVQSCDTVYLTLPQFGWNAKIFEVNTISFLIDSDGTCGVDLELRETASGIYDWNSGEQTTVDLASNTDLPDPTQVAAPSNVQLFSGTAQLYIRQDGTVQTRVLMTWDTTSTEFVQIGGQFEIQFKKTADSIWTNAHNVPGDSTFTYITDVNDQVHYDFRIREVNTIGAKSDYTEIDNYLVLGKGEDPSDVTVFSVLVNDAGLLYHWDQITDLDRSEYEIRHGGMDWDSATFIWRGQTSGNSYLFGYGTVGTIISRIKAIDTSGNYSLNSKDISTDLIGPNPARSFTASTVKQNVLLDWIEPAASTFSVHKYNVYKGDVFNTAVKIGVAFGTFHTYIEQTGGTFTYWVVAEDIWGNLASEVSAITTVTVPDDFFIQDSQNPLLSLTDHENCIIGGTSDAPLEDPGSVWLPVKIILSEGALSLPLLMGGGAVYETFDDWFTANGWSTLQDAIDAGFVSWLQPATLDAGFLEMVINYAVTFASSFINLSYTENTLGTDITPIIVTLSTSPDGVIYDQTGTTKQLFSHTFQYLKIRLDFAATSVFSLTVLKDFLVTISLQIEEETDIVACLAADSGGTIQTFSKHFLDVQDIQLTVEGTDSFYAVLNFNDIPNPPNFQVLVFDQDGNRVDASVRARTRGAVQP